MNPPLDAFPHHETERLVIRPLSLDDADIVAKLTNDPAITEVVHFLPSPFTSSNAKALIGNNDEDNCFLGAFVQDELVGVIGAHAHGDDCLEIGYWIGTKFQRRGYAFEAASGVIAQLQNIYPTRQIVAECRVGNDPSWVLLHKLGFRAAGQQGKRPGRELLLLS